jgi:Family of unknown function (DUF5397)
MNIRTSAPHAGVVGSIRRFGPHGVLYEVLEVLDDQRALIRVIDTGEETPYSLSKISADPAN